MRSRATGAFVFTAFLTAMMAVGGGCDGAGSDDDTVPDDDDDTTDDVVDWTGTWAFDPTQPVVRSGDKGSWLDEVAASDPHAIERDGEIWLYYTCSGRHDSDETEIRTRICLATSGDGISFQRHPDNPVLDLAPDGAWDSWALETAFVLDGDPMRMYYMGYDTDDADAWLAGEAITVGSIGLATSDDGVRFERFGSDPVLAPTPGPKYFAIGTWDSFALEGPWVIEDDGAYVMYYGGAGSIDGVTEINAIGVATSTDGEVWTKDERNPVFEGRDDAWDRYHIIDPCVVHDGDTYYLWYQGGDFVGKTAYGNFHIGVATSTDGIEWQRPSDEPVLRNGEDGTWNDYGVMAPSVLRREDEEPLMYVHGLDAWPDLGVWAVGRAVLDQS